MIGIGVLSRACCLSALQFSSKDGFPPRFERGSHIQEILNILGGHVGYGSLEMIEILVGIGGGVIAALGLGAGFRLLSPEKHSFTLSVRFCWVQHWRTAAVTRFRTGLEASRGYRFQRGLSLQPSLEIGLRRDGGDAETGAGVDIGGGLIVSDALTGLSADFIRVRMLLAHQDEEFRERGMSIAFSFDPTPSTPLGFLAKVSPSWGGQATGGTEALWGRDTMTGLANGGHAGGGSLAADLSYGMAVGSRLVGTPRIGFGTSGMGRDYRFGYGLGLIGAPGPAFELGTDVQRRESISGNGVDNALVAGFTARW